MAAILNLNDKNFKEIALKSGARVLVDFWAPWCAPCVGIGKRLEEKVSEFADRLTFVKVNADESIDTATNYGVRGLPTLILIKDGKHIDTVVGALTPSKLDALLVKWAST